MTPLNSTPDIIEGLIADAGSVAERMPSSKDVAAIDEETDKKETTVDPEVSKEEQEKIDARLLDKMEDYPVFGLSDRDALFKAIDDIKNTDGVFDDKIRELIEKKRDKM